MRLLHNKEIIVFSVMLLLLAAAGAAACFFVSYTAGIISAVLSLIFMISFFVFTGWRYYQIESLSAYLRQINGGNYSLDVRDNAEGELSILKSELYKVTVMLRQQNETLKSEKTKLSQALSDISHQLKTPLTSMFMMTDLLLGSELPEDRRKEFTDRMRVQLERLEWLVSSLLKLSRLDAKSIGFNPRPVPAKRLLENALAPLLIPAELKNQTFTKKPDGVSVICDEKWTAEALLNILKNCVEHTPKNGVVEIMCSDNPLYTEIRIRDDGPGIDENDLPYIFNRFYRGNNASDDSIGIGLSMAAAIIGEQGGSVDAKNAPSGGSVFTIRFPK